MAPLRASLDLYTSRRSFPRSRVEDVKDWTLLVSQSQDCIFWGSNNYLVSNPIEPRCRLFKMILAGWQLNEQPNGLAFEALKKMWRVKMENL